MDHQWLREAASRLNILHTPDLGTTASIPPARTFRTQADATTATNTLQLQINDRCNSMSGSRKALTLQSNASRSLPTYPDFCKAMSLLVQDLSGPIQSPTSLNSSGSHPTTGVLEALLEQFFGGVLKRPKRSVLHCRNNVAAETRKRYAGELIDRAWQAGQLDAVDVLSRYSDPKSLQDLLVQAMRTKRIDFMAIALRSGADPNKEQGPLQEAITRGDDTFVQLLLNAPVPISATSVSRSLDPAIRARNFSTTQILLNAGADAGYNDAEACGLAVDADLTDFVLAMLLSRNPPGPRHLDRLVSRLSNRVHGVDQKEMFEILVHGGAAGDGVAALLVAAASEGSVDFCRLLVQKNASVQFRNGEAFKNAMQHSNLDILRELNKSKLGVALATDLFDKIPQQNEILSASSLEIMTMLLEQGANGDPIHRALERSVQAQDDLAVNQLLSHGASVNHGGGRTLVKAVETNNKELIALLLQHHADQRTTTGAIRTAVSTSNLPVLQLILDNGKPNQESTDAGFGDVMKLSVGDPRTRLADALLDYGVSRRSKSDAIIQEVRELSESGMNSTYLLEKLIRLGGDINCEDGKALRLAVASAKMDLLRILMDAHPSSASIDAAFIHIGQKTPREASIEMLLLLLEAKVSQSKRDVALVLAISQTPPDKDFVHKLVQFEASADFDDGKACCKAVELAHDHPDLLPALLRRSPNQDTLRKAFAQSLSISKERTRLGVWEQLLPAGLHGDPVNSALIEAARGSGLHKQEACRLLLRYHASVDFQDGAAIRQAMKLPDLTIFNILLGGKPSKVTAASCLGDVEHISGDIRHPICKALLNLHVLKKSSSRLLAAVASQSIEDEGLVQLLLHHGASVGFNDSECLRKAVEVNNNKVLGLLLSAGPSRETLAILFDAAFGSGNYGQSKTKLRTMELLLGAGARGSRLNEALVKALSHSSTSCRAFVTMLLSAGADVNWNEGLPLHTAVKQKSPELVGQLLEQTLTNETMCSAIHTLVKKGKDVSTTLRILDAFAAAANRPVLQSQYTGLDTPFVHALKAYSNPSSILGRLILLGSDVNQRIKCRVLPNGDPENASLLCWAICQESITDATLCYIIGCGGTFNCNMWISLIG